MERAWIRNDPPETGVMLKLPGSRNSTSITVSVMAPIPVHRCRTSVAPSIQYSTKGPEGSDVVRPRCLTAPAEGTEA